MADKTVDGEPWMGCAVMFLQSLFPGMDLLALYKDLQGKFIIFKVIKLTLRGKSQQLGPTREDWCTKLSQAVT